MIDTEIIASLRERIRSIESGSRFDLSCTSLGCPALDAIAPDGGLAAGTIHEWLALRPGSGAEILSLVATRYICCHGGALVVIDPGCCFYPPAAFRWGIDLDNTIVLRGCPPRDMAWAIDQALRSSSVAAVWGYLGAIHPRWLRRFQLSAEQSGSVGLFIRPAAVRQQPSWCAARWLCRGRGLPAVSSSPACLPIDRPRRFLSQAGEVRFVESVPYESASSRDRRIEVNLLRARGGRAGMTVAVRIDFETGTVSGEQRNEQALSLHLARQLAHPAARRRAARA